MAALLVLVTHATFYTSERLDKGVHFWRLGATGVDLFFVISGFVMVFSSDSLRTVPLGWRIFAERRVVRIVPMYWLATSVKLIAMLLTTGYVLHAQLSWVRVVCSYLFLPSLGTDGKPEPLLNVGWTLVFEMFFYAIFALALFLRTNVYRFCGFVLFLLALGAFFRKPEWPAAAFYLNTVVLEFFLGMLIARQCLLRRHLPRVVAIPMFFVGFSLLLYPWPEAITTRILYCGIPAALIIWATASLEDGLQWIPRWVIFLGEASYAIYLFHPLVAPSVPAVLFKLHERNDWLSVLLCIAVALGVGALLFRFVETPITAFFRERVRILHRRFIHLPG